MWCEMCGMSVRSIMDNLFFLICISAGVVEVDMKTHFPPTFVATASQPEPLRVTSAE